MIIYLIMNVNIYGYVYDCDVVVSLRCIARLELMDQV